MHYAQTDLFDLLSNDFDIKLVLNGMKDIIQAINWLHEQGLVHHDIKPENIVFHDHKFKLIDFDFTAPLEELHFCGTKNFICNENIVRHWHVDNTIISKRMDNYSFGKTIYSILWQACIHKYIPKSKKKIWDRFHSDIVIKDSLKLKPVWQQWLDLADQCCSIKSLDILPTTMKNTLATENLSTIVTLTKVVDADPMFA
jgi:serine/threonine protein kinase